MVEYQTSEFVIEKLKSFGITDIKKVGETGVVALIKGNSSRCLAIRADMDALPFQENTPVPFISKMMELPMHVGMIYTQLAY